MLKQKLLFAVGSLCAMMLASTSMSAQYDDMYYDPDEFRTTETTRGYYDEPATNDRITGQQERRRVSNSNDNDYYDYYYSSRIRRFNRPYRGFGYFDPVYVDMAYYDPFYRAGGTTVLIYNDYNRFNRFASPFTRPIVTPYGVRYVDTRFGGFNRSWGSPFYRGWNDPFYGNAYAGGLNRGFYGANALGGGFGGGFLGGAGYYCPPAWGGGNTYSVPNSVQNRPVVNVPRASSVSIADRVERARQTRNVTSRSAQPAVRGATRSGAATRSAPATRGTRSASSIDRSRTTVQPRSSNATRTRSTSATRRATPSRATTPQRRTYTPNRSTTPQRATTPNRGNSRSYTPSRSTSPTRTYTPSRSTAPSRSVTPSRSSGSSRSASPSRSSGSSRTSTPTRRGGGR